MSARLRTASIALLAVVAALLLAGCGNADKRVTTGTYAGEGGANAPYLNVGPLVYQVQLSRELNPYNNEDSNYLKGVGVAESTLAPGEMWFGVFLQVYNRTNARLIASDSIYITDTQNNIYHPLPLSRLNTFAYRAGPVPGRGQLPVPGTPERAFGSEGQLLLFKIPVSAYDNRPLEIRITDPENPARSASAELDV